MISALDSPSSLIHHAAGEPPHKYAEEVTSDKAAGGVCATCAATINCGVPTEAVNNPTFSNHAEFFKFGTHVCPACAWMYGDPKRTHRNVLCVGEELWWPMISIESATEERPSWMELFGRLASASPPPDTPLTGVLTTDPKPRLWPRCRMAAAGSPGLYVHAPDYDVSEWRGFDLGILHDVSRAVRECLLLGFSKSRIHGGLLADYAKAKKRMREVMRLENELRRMRPWPEFTVALLTAQVSKEEKNEWKERNDGSDKNHGTGDIGGAGAGREARGQAREDPPRLL